jgi:uncharacterized membrane protein
LFPVLELRGGLIAATLLQVPMLKAVPLCIIGNIIPIPFILFFIKKIFHWLKRFRLFQKPVEWMENKALGKSDRVKKYEFLGLFLFVGIPLPGTGAWTGSLIAALLDVDIKKAVAAELLGLCLATVIMCIFSYGILGNIVS